MTLLPQPRRKTHSRTDLSADLRELGLSAGDIVFMHSSYKSLGTVDGGVQALIGALEDVVGPTGLVLMPSFNLSPPFERRHEFWQPATTPSSVGWITECFRTLPGTVRSDHYSHSVAARGAGAVAFVADHLSLEGLESPWDRAPWGKTYGSHSPMVRAYTGGGQLLMLGVQYNSSTYVHFVEVLYWDLLRHRNGAVAFPRLDREALGAFWDRLGLLRLGAVGDARCRFFPIRDYVDRLLAEVCAQPDQYLRNA